MRRLYKDAKQKQRDTLNLFGIDLKSTNNDYFAFGDNEIEEEQASPNDMDKIKSQSSNEMLSQLNRSQIYATKLGDVIEEEFSHDETQTDKKQD